MTARRWLTTWIDAATRPHPTLTELGDQRRARLLLAFALLIGVLGTVGALATLLSRGPATAGIALFGWLGILCALAYGFGRSAYYKFGASLLAAGIGALGPLELFRGQTHPDQAVGVMLSTVILGLVLGNVLFSLRGQALLLVGLSVLTTLPAQFVPGITNRFGAFGVVLTVGSLLLVATRFRDNLEWTRLSALNLANAELRAMQDTLEARVAERTRRAEEARQEAEAARTTVEAHAWRSTGEVHVNSALRGAQSLPSLGANVTRALCQYLSAPVGALYVLRDETLEWVAGYAYVPPSDTPTHWRLGSGLVGQCARDRRPLLVSDAPPTTLPLVSALGTAPTSTILLTPLLYNDAVQGVLVLGTFTHFTAEHLALLNAVSETIAIALDTTLARAHAEELLAQTQLQASVLMATQAELRAVNEELAAQADDRDATRKQGGPYAR